MATHEKEQFSKDQKIWLKKVFGKNVEFLPDGKVICNQHVSLVPYNWDDMAAMDLATGEGFRITEQGKTDINKEPGLYSIHSKLYGTDWNDENAFEDRWRCKCGRLQGKFNKGRYHDACKSYVEFRDIDMGKTGWIILDRHCVIQSLFYKKLGSFIGIKRLDNILRYAEEPDRHPSADNPFYGIGMMEFKERFHEIMDFYCKKNKSKMDMYTFIMVHEDFVFTHSIPVYNMFLRQFLIKGSDIKYSDEDKIYRKIFSDHMLLNDRFVLMRRKEVRKKRNKDMFYLREENILFRIQTELNKLWDLTFATVKDKTGVIREQILGGRLNFTARNVIVPNTELKANEIGVGYITFLELYKLELIAMLVKLYGFTYPKAWNMWQEASMVFNETIYKLMCHMIKHQKLIVSIDRNPSINYGSMLAMRIVEVYPDITDHCLSLPISILTKPNADFDGDIMNILVHKLKDIAEEYDKRLNPRFNMFVSRNDGLFDMDCAPFKDQIIGIYSFANYD